MASTFRRCESCQGRGFFFGPTIPLTDCDDCEASGFLEEPLCDVCGKEKGVQQTADRLVICEKCAAPEPRHDTMPCPPPSSATVLEVEDEEQTQEIDLSRVLEESVELTQAARAVGMPTRRALRIGRAAR